MKTSNWFSAGQGKIADQTQEATYRVKFFAVSGGGSLATVGAESIVEMDFDNTNWDTEREITIQGDHSHTGPSDPPANLKSTKKFYVHHRVESNLSIPNPSPPVYRPPVLGSWNNETNAPNADGLYVADDEAGCQWAK